MLPNLLPVLIPVLSVMPITAQGTDTLRLEAAIATALVANPGLRAAEYGVVAASERVAPAGTLPDPQVVLSLMNRPLFGFGASERMTMNQIQLTQTLPWPGKLGDHQAQMRHLALARALDTDEIEARLVADVTIAYYELASIDRMITILVRTRELLRTFFEVSQTRYAVGDGIQQDVLQAQVAIAGTTEDITVLRQTRVANTARFNALLGRHPGTAVPSLELPPVGTELPSLDTLMIAAQAERPALRAAVERLAAAEAAHDLARRAAYPDFTLGMAYAQRPDFEDLASLSVGVRVPLWAGSRQAPLRRASEAVKAQEEARARDMENETYALLAEFRAAAERARHLADLYRTAILPQARAAVESAMSGYRVGQVDYMTLVQSEMTVNRYDIEAVRLAAQYHQAVAQIGALLGKRGGTP